MKRKIKTTLGIIYKQVLDKIDDIPAPALGRLGNALQTIGGTVAAAGMVALAVAGNTITNGEAFQLILFGYGFLACGTIIDIKSCHKQER